MKKATRQFTKQHNRHLVLKTVFKERGFSRADISRKTGLTRTTVSEIVSELIAEGLVEEAGPGFSASGKPPIKVAVLDDARQVICLDLSKKSISGAVVNLRGKIIHQTALPMPHDNLNEFFSLLCAQLNQLIASASAPILGIGIGTPGLVDAAQGVIRRAVNLNFADVPLKSYLSQRYPFPVYIANDSHAAAMAEYTYGKFRDVPNLIVIKIGEGIGSGIVLSGQIFFGDGFAAGEIGHLGIVENGSLCTCGNCGCLETVSSTRAVLQKVRQLAQTAPHLLDPSLMEEDFTLSAVFRSFNAGNPAVGEIIHEAARYLGIAIAHLIAVLDIQNVVISGDFVELGPPFLQAIQDSVQRFMLPGMSNKTAIHYSTLGAENVILGASALVLSQELNLP